MPDLHHRLLAYVSEAVTSFVRDLDTNKGCADAVVVMLCSEFGRRLAENAKQGADHGTANVLLAGKPIRVRHYGIPMDLSVLGPQ